jgi:PRTRC genetic system protein E
MLITSLLPLLSRYSLGFDLVSGPDGTVTLTIIPRKAEGSSAKPEAGELRPIAITATAAEIDAELTRGAEGALGQLITARKDLADQIAEQRKAAEATKSKIKTPASPKAAAPAVTDKAAVPAPSPDPAPGEPATLW